MQSTPPPPSTTLLSAQEAKERLREIVEGFFFRRLKTEDGKRIAMEVKKGDRILIGKYSGTDVKIDGTEYTILREDDVLGILADKK